MTSIITANQFVSSLFAALAKVGKSELFFTSVDQAFERMYEDFLALESSRGVVSNFTFFVEALHGDSASLREALLEAQDREIIELHESNFHRMRITIANPQKRLDQAPIGEFFESLASTYFTSGRTGPWTFSTPT